MIDREAAAGLAELLTSRIGENFDGECHLTEEEARAGIRSITTLLSELERVGKENDKLRDLHRRASEETGELLGRALKAEALVAEAIEKEADAILDDANWSTQIRYGAKMLRDALFARFRPLPTPGEQG